MEIYITFINVSIMGFINICDVKQYNIDQLNKCLVLKYVDSISTKPTAPAVGFFHAPHLEFSS
ncbi:hypothetical protein FLM53_01055 [Vibrio sp. Scap24]|nr:hypothetical protein [Vibrio sp. Scap16]QLE91749.1 hypothetical protein FLM53_01055 [Vibrio sp. Scap24]